MNLHLLIPTLRQCCSLALGYHDAGIINEEAAFYIAFDTKNNPQIIFYGHNEDANSPRHIAYSAVIISGCVHTLTDTIAGMALSHEKSVERLANHILVNLNKLIYDLKLSDSRMLELAAILDEYATAGITGGIANSKKTPPKKPVVATCDHPERN